MSLNVLNQIYGKFAYPTEALRCRFLFKIDFFESWFNLFYLGLKQAMKTPTVTTNQSVDITKHFFIWKTSNPVSSFKQNFPTNGMK